jgi:hypothetical protein
MSRSSSPNTMTTTTLVPLNMKMMPMPTKMKIIGVTLSPDQRSWLTLIWRRRVVSKLSNHCPCAPHLHAYAGKRIYPDTIAEVIDQPDLVNLIQQFLHDQCRSDSESDELSSNNLNLPEFHEKIRIFPSAVATFHAPSDISGIGGMRYERIHAVAAWRKGPARYDCVFVNTDPSATGMRGFDIARVRLLFSFKHEGTTYPCALVHWYSRVGDSPDEDTGMWVVEPDYLEDRTHFASVIHLDTIFRAAHLMAVYGNEYAPTYLSFDQSLDAFRAYYVNKYIDHQAFETAF